MLLGLGLRHGFLLVTMATGWALRLGEPAAPAPLPAFPRAESAGRFTTGGRGTAAAPTTVLEVTNLLDDNQPGCLRYAVQLNAKKAPARTIMFRVAGTIHLLSPLTLNKPKPPLRVKRPPAVASAWPTSR